MFTTEYEQVSSQENNLNELFINNNHDNPYILSVNTNNNKINDKSKILTVTTHRPGLWILIIILLSIICTIISDISLDIDKTYSFYGQTVEKILLLCYAFQYIFQIILNNRRNQTTGLSNNGIHWLWLTNSFIFLLCIIEYINKDITDNNDDPYVNSQESSSDTVDIKVCNVWVVIFSIWNIFATTFLTWQCGLPNSFNKILIFSLLLINTVVVIVLAYKSDLLNPVITYDTWIVCMESLVVISLTVSATYQIGSNKTYRRFIGQDLTCVWLQLIGSLSLCYLIITNLTLYRDLFPISFNTLSSELLLLTYATIMVVSNVIYLLQYLCYEFNNKVEKTNFFSHFNINNEKIENYLPVALLVDSNDSMLTDSLNTSSPLHNPSAPNFVMD